MPRVLIFHNPASGKGRKVAQILRDNLAANEGNLLDWEIDWAVLGELGGPPEGLSKLIVVGGDGTVNAGAGFLIQNHLDIPLGIIPAGTGNNLCSGLGLPSDPVAAFRIALASEKVRPLDAIRIDTPGRETPCYMVQTSALGFPARICGQYDRLRRLRILGAFIGRLGPTVYRVLALGGLAAQKIREKRRRGLLEFRCRFPGGEIRETAIAAMIGNERSTGGDFIPCPQAAPDDGLMDICLLRAGTGVSYLKVFREIVRGTHIGKFDAVLYLQTPGPLEIELSEPTPLLVDGDLPVTGARFQYTVLPQRLHMTIE